jgi:non-ribosomal peptide synthetase component F
MFVNTLVIRTDLSSDPRFCDLVGQVRTVALEAFCHADIPFVKLIEQLKPPRSPGYNPVFQVMFAAVRSALQPSTDWQLNASPYVVARATSRFDLTMNLIECADEQRLMQLEYNTRSLSKYSDCETTRRLCFRVT